MKFQEIFSKKKQESNGYPTYAAALKDCNNNGYQDLSLCRVVARKTKTYREELARLPFEINAVQCYLELTIQHILLQNGSTSIAVADFGGACGAHYYETRRLIPGEISMKWQVIETAAMVNSAYKHELHTHELNFFADVEQVRADLFYLSSSLQYVPDPYGLLDTLVSRAYPYILFNRMMLDMVSDEDEIIIQQSLLSANGPGPMPDGEEDAIITYPHTTLSQKKFLKKFEADYDLVFTFAEPSGKINGSEHIFGGGFLFRRK